MFCPHSNSKCFFPTLIPSILSPHGDCSPKRVNACLARLFDCSFVYFRFFFNSVSVSACFSFFRFCFSFFCSCSCSCCVLCVYFFPATPFTPCLRRFLYRRAYLCARLVIMYSRRVEGGGQHVYVYTYQVHTSRGYMFLPVYCSCT